MKPVVLCEVLFRVAIILGGGEGILEIVSCKNLFLHLFLLFNLILLDLNKLRLKHMRCYTPGGSKDSGCTLD